MKNAAYVMIFNLVAQLLGFSLNILMAQNIGVSLEMDTFRLAQSYSFAVSVPVFAAIQVTFIPMYVATLKKSGEEQADKIYHQLGKIVKFALMIIGSAFLLFAVVSSRFLWADNQSAQQLFILLCFILYIGQIFYTYSVMSMAFLQAKGRFFVQSFSVVLTNLVPVAYFLFFYGKQTSVITVMALLSLGYLFQCLIIRLYTRKYVTRRKVYSDLTVRQIVKDERMKEFLFLAVPVLLSNVVLKISDMTEQSTAVLIGVGQLSILSFSYLLYTAILGLSVSPFVTVIYPKLVKFMTEKNQLSREHFANILAVILTIVIPIIAGFILFGQNVLEVMLSPRYSAEEIQITYLLTNLYLAGVIFFAAREIIYRVFYTAGQQSVVMKNTLYTAGVRIIAIFILGSMFALTGIVLALTTSIVFSLVKISGRAKKLLIGKYNKKSLAIYFLELVGILGVAIACSSAVRWILTTAEINAFIATIVGGVVFISIYAGAIVILKTNVFKNIIKYMSI